MTGSKRKKIVTKQWLAIGVVALLAGAWFLTSYQDTQTDIVVRGIVLPESNRQETAEESKLYLYASNQEISDLLTELDIHFKSQGLGSDTNSEVFQYETGRDKAQLLEKCVDFNYFKDGKVAVTATLIPENPECFTKEQSLHSKLSSLHAEYQYVYAVRLN